MRNLIDASIRPVRRRRATRWTLLNTSFMRETAAALESSLDTDRVQRFRSLLDGPLAIVASGGSYTTALLWAHLHESSGSPAWAMTPYAFAQRLLPAGTRVLLLSASGQHHDIVRNAELAIERGHDTRAVTCRVNSPLAERVGQAASSDAVLVVGEPAHADGLIAVQSVVAFSVLAARTYAGAGPWAPCFEDASISLPARVPRFVVAFGAGGAEPAAVDFDGRLVRRAQLPGPQFHARPDAAGRRRAVLSFQLRRAWRGRHRRSGQRAHIPTNRSSKRTANTSIRKRAANSRAGFRSTCARLSRAVICRLPKCARCRNSKRWCCCKKVAACRYRRSAPGSGKRC